MVRFRRRFCWLMSLGAASCDTPTEAEVAVHADDGDSVEPTSEAEQSIAPAEGGVGTDAEREPDAPGDTASDVRIEVTETAIGIEEPAPSPECLERAMFEFVNGELVPLAGAGEIEGCADASYLTPDGDCTRPGCVLASGAQCVHEGVQTCCAGQPCRGDCVDGVRCVCGETQGGCVPLSSAPYCRAREGQPSVCGPPRNAR